MAENKLRVTLDLAPKAAERLMRLKGLLELDTKAGVVRQSLQLHEFLINEVKAGKRVFIGENKEDSAEIVLFHIPQIGG